VTSEAEDALHRAVLTSRVRLTLSGHTNWVTSVAYSPVGSRLATASNDRTARVWEVASGREMFALTGYTDSVTSVAFSPDGSRLATVSWDKTVRVYALSPNIEALIALAQTRVTRSLTAEECQKFLHVEQCPPTP
jgi:WD40 repeat protein